MICKPEKMQEKCKIIFLLFLFLKFGQYNCMFSDCKAFHKNCILMSGRKKINELIFSWINQIGKLKIENSLTDAIF